MTMAAVSEARPCEGRGFGCAGGRARRGVRQTSAPSSSEWRALEQGQTATPYQRFDLVNAWQDNVGVQSRRKSRCRWSPMTATSGRHGAAAGRSTRSVRFASPAFPAASIPTSTCRSGGASSPRPQRARTCEASCRCSARRDPTLDVLALNQQPLDWNGAHQSVRAVAAPAVGERMSAADDRSEGARGRLHQQLVPPQAERQGAQAAGAARLSLLRRPQRGGRHAAARRVLRHQAAADGRAEDQERVRRARHRDSSSAAPASTASPPARRRSSCTALNATPRSSRSSPASVTAIASRRCSTPTRCRRRRETARASC